MRRLRLFSLALAGLACCLPSTARAGFPLLGSTDNGQVKPRHKAHHAAHKTGYICPDCQARMMASAEGPAPVVVSGTPTAVIAAGPCVSCGVEVPVASCSACASTAAAAEAPGLAFVGGGNPSAAMASTGGAPGYAQVGGMVASAEPVPIGVVRTNYAPQPTPGSLGASVAAAPGGPAGPNTLPYARPDEVPPSLYAPPTPRRHRILSKVLGLPQFGRLRAEAESHARESHAMTSYGPAEAPTTLPASMVYGR